MKIRVCEVFTSIQGEGPYIGLPVVFVRLSGCNLLCDYCDTKYSWFNGTEVEVSELVSKIEVLGLKNVVYTGGEPLLQAEALQELAEVLYRRHYTQMIETNASVVPYNLKELARFIRVWVLSPKLPTMNPRYRFEDFESLLKSLVENACEVYVKFVVGNADEVEIVDKIYGGLLRRYYIPPEYVFLQPLDGGNITYVELVQRVINGRKGYRVLPQLHKLYGFK